MKLDTTRPINVTVEAHALGETIVFDTELGQLSSLKVELKVDVSHIPDTSVHDYSKEHLIGEIEAQIYAVEVSPWEGLSVKQKYADIANSELDYIFDEGVIGLEIDRLFLEAQESERGEVPFGMFSLTLGLGELMSGYIIVKIHQAVV